MNTTRKVLLSALIVGAIGSVVALGAFSAFSGTTSNAGNTFTAGSVAIQDNDGGSTPMYQVLNAAPGVTNDSCIRVTYTGTLDSSVKLYSTPITGTGAGYVDLSVTPGTTGGTPFKDCSTFVADPSGPIYSGTAGGFPTSYAAGITDNPGSSSKWSTGDVVVYRFRTSVQDNNLAQGTSVGAHQFTWEARNQ